METFKEFVNAGAFSNTSWGGFDDRINAMPTPTLDIPTKTIEATIREIRYNQNPISIVLDDGTRIAMNKTQWDYLCSQGKELREGLRIHLEMFLDGTIKAVNLL